MPQLQLFATCPKSIEDLLLDELRELGAADVKETVAGVHFAGSLAVAYRVILRSRFANRVLLPLAEFDAKDREELLEGVQSIPWSDHLDVDGTFAVEASTSSSALRHADFVALVVKDGIADSFRSSHGRRPNVKPRDPDLKVNLHLSHDHAIASIDLSGGSLHRRAYRVRGVAAPLKENVASAMLARARWAEIAADGGSFVDPMCGSGTLLIEAVLMAGKVAPGLLRLMRDEERGRKGGLKEALERLSRTSDSAGAADRGAGARFLPQGWRGNDPGAWSRETISAASSSLSGFEHLPPVRGSDYDGAAVAAARANISACGLNGIIEVERRELSKLTTPEEQKGLVAMNPPYGERIGAQNTLEELYQEIGRTLHAHFQGWRACVLTSEIDLSHAVGLRAARTNTLYNGALRCVLAHFELAADNRFLARAPEQKREAGGGSREKSDAPAASRPAAPKGPSRETRSAPLGPSPRSGGAPLPKAIRIEKPQGQVERSANTGISSLGGIEKRFQETQGILSFVNRIRKNRKILGKWAEANGVTCYRLYDADLPEYAVAVDFFEGRWLHVQEYVAPREIDAEKASERLDDIVTVLPDAVGVPPENVFLKRRKRRKRTEQYTRMENRGEFYEVHEGGYSFLVNFTDYLDTGLFLDHRPTRELIRSFSKDSRVLNLFAYTCTASVYAVKGGARSTTSIDSSNTYLKWARENYSANGIAGQQHQLLRADCWEWLHVDREQYDLIFMDPPTFSNAKGKRATLDVQRDHPKLVRLAAARLAPGGVLIFSTNYRRFHFDRAELSEYTVEDITPATIPRDFDRNRRIHSTFRISRGPR